MNYFLLAAKESLNVSKYDSSSKVKFKKISLSVLLSSTIFFKAIWPIKKKTNVN